MQKKKKTVIIISIFLVIGLIIGVFWLGRISTNNQSPEPKKHLSPEKPKQPSPNNKNEEKTTYIGMTFNEAGRVSQYAVFDNFSRFLDSSEYPDIKVFYISKNHPRIKQLLSERKLQERGKLFTIRYGKLISKKTRYFFEENDRDLEIREV